MWKHDNNLLWHLNPRKLLWHFQIGSFIWICCLGHKPSTLSLIPPRIMFLEGAVPPLSTSEVPPAPARDTRAPMAMVSKAKRHWGPSAWESSPRPGRPWEPWSGSVQQTQMLMIDPKNFKTKSYLFILLCPHHMHKHSKADTLPHTILLSFPEKPSLHICTAAEAARNMCTEQRGGSLAGHVAVAAQSQPGLPCWHWLRGCNALPPPSSRDGRYEWSCAGASRHSQQRAEGWAQLSVRVWHCLTKLQSVTIWHNDMYDHSVLWKNVELLYQV